MADAFTEAELDALAAALPPGPALTNLLAGAGLPAAVLPNPYGLTGEEYWAMVGSAVARGAAPDGRRKVLAYAARRFPANPAFRGLPRRILVVSAAADGRAPVRAARELREIVEALDGSGTAVDHVPAAAPADLARLAGPYRPDLLHLSCHGAAGALEFEQRDGAALRIPAAELAELVGRLAGPGRPRLLGVVVAACDSEAVVEALRPHAATVIGHRGALNDEDAVLFAAHLYRLLREGAGDLGLADAAYAAAQLVTGTVHGRRWLEDGLLVADDRSP